MTAALALIEGLSADAPIGFALVEPGPAVVALSPSLRALGGLPAELEAAVAAALGGERAPEDVPATAGGRRWLATVRGIDVEGRRLAGVVLVDVTPGWEAEQALRESSRQLAAAQRLARMGWWLWSVRTQELAVSPELGALLGIEPAAGAVDPDGWLRDVPAEDRARIDAEIGAAVRERRAFAYRYRRRRDEGGEMVLDTHGAPVFDPSGELVAIHAFVQDVTALAQAAERQHALAEIGRIGLGGAPLEQVLDRARELVAGALRVDDVAIGEHGMVTVPRPLDADETAFLQSVAHVLGEATARREAAGEIAGLAAARGRLVAQALDAEARARRGISEHLHDGPLQDVLATGHDLYGLGDIPGAVAARRRLQEIVSDLRDVMVALHPTVVQYGGLAAALSALAEQHGRAAGFGATVTVDDDALGVHDELLLSVARQLLVNVARHAQATHVELGLHRRNGEIVLELADDGRGLPGPDARAGPAQGGLGLATSAERVAAVGGRLEAAPREGGGTRVAVRLPG